MKSGKEIVSMPVFCLFTAAVNAMGPAVPHQFQSGSPAAEREVNDNSQELANRIQNPSDVFTER